jgi:hypothetical protein
VQCLEAAGSRQGVQWLQATDTKQRMGCSETAGLVWREAAGSGGVVQCLEAPGDSPQVQEVETAGSSQQEQRLEADGSVQEVQWLQPADARQGMGCLGAAGEA